MVVLSVLATASPGIGILGWILLLLPGQLLDCLHAPAYGFLAWLSIIGLYRRRWPLPYALVAGSLFAFLFGLWTETLQGSVPGRAVLNSKIWWLMGWVLSWRLPSCCGN